MSGYEDGYRMSSRMTITEARFLHGGIAVMVLGLLWCSTSMCTAQSADDAALAGARPTLKSSSVTVSRHLSERIAWSVTRTGDRRRPASASLQPWRLRGMLPSARSGKRRPPG